MRFGLRFATSFPVRCTESREAHPDGDMNLGTARDMCSGRALAKSLSVLLVSGAVLVANPACQAQAQPQPPELRHDMPAQPDALSQAQFDAIVTEAREVARATAETHDIRHWPATWQHLDRAALAAWWRMPQSAAVDEPVRITLVEQAAVWDMLSFDRPSEAAQLWRRMWPRQPAARDTGNPNATSWSFDEQWSDRSTAMLALFQCYPASAWMSDGEAPVWALENRKSWHVSWGAADPWGDFQQCIKSTTRERADAVSAVLEELFTRELLRDRCSGSGPDSCLAVYGALYSIHRRNPRLPELLKLMEPALDPGNSLTLPVDADSLPAMENELERRRMFITIKLPVVLDRRLRPRGRCGFAGPGRRSACRGP